MEGAVILDHRVRGVKPGPVDLVDLLLGKPSLLGQAIVVLLHPAVDEPLPPQVAQYVVCRRRPLVVFDKTLFWLNNSTKYSAIIRLNIIWQNTELNILQNTRYSAVLYNKKQLASCQMYFSEYS